MNLFQSLANQPRVRATGTAKKRTQKQTCVLLANQILTRLYEGEATDNATLEAACGVSRVGVYLGNGYGGKDGLGLFRSKDGVEPCQENVQGLALALGEAEFTAWMTSVGLDEDGFKAWYSALPKAAP